MSDILEDDALDELFEEGELVVEEQDLRLIKGIVTEHEIAREFASSTDSRLFMGDARAFADSAIAYYKKFNSLPTRRVMMELTEASPDLNEATSEIWDRLDSVEFNKSEFNYDMAKIKQRYTQQKIASMHQTIQDGSDIDEVLLNLKRDLDDAEQVRRGKKSTAFTQRTMKDYIQEFRADYVEKQKNPEKGRGIMTNYAYLDYVTNGLSPSDMLIIGGETGAGKMLKLETLIPTPNGFKEIGNLHTGDKVLGRDGRACTVVAESAVEIEEGWKFIFNDGSEVISHDNHEWLTFDRKEQVALSKRTPEFRAKRKTNRKSRAVKNTKPWLAEANRNREYDLLPPPTGTIRTSKEIAETLFVHKNKRRNHAVPIAEPIELPDKDLLIDPYLFGCWLGDGTSKDGAITSMDQEIVDSFIKCGYVLLKTTTRTYKNGHTSKASTFKFDNLRKELRTLNVFGNKHIPHDYLWSSKEQRLALLQGLMDTDGFVSSRGQIDFVNTNKSLAEGVAHLVRSLGEKCTITKGEAKLNGKVTGPKWTVRFSSSLPVFRLTRKLERQNLTQRLNKFRYIVDAIRVDAVPMKCIQVDSPDHLYLCTENFIPTHNSMLLSNMAVQMWMQQNTICDPEDPKIPTTEFTKGYNIQYFSLEMPFDQCFRRAFARIGALPTYGLRDARISDPDMLQRMSHAAKFIKEYPYEFEIVDIPRGVTVQDIEDRFLDSVARGVKPDIIVVDYLGLMQDPKSDGDDWLRLGNISGELHELARMYDIVMLSAVQLNRPSTRKPEDAIGMHRIGRSSLIMHHASIGVQIETRKDEDAMKDLKYHVIKNRNGERGHHLLKKDFRTATVCDLAEGYKPKYEESSFKSNNPGLEDISQVLDNFGWSP